MQFQRTKNNFFSVIIGLVVSGFAIFSPVCHAITFVTEPIVVWNMIEAVPNGCVTQLKDQVHNHIYVGACNHASQPHGRGILFKDAQKYAVKANEGKMFSQELLNKAGNQTGNQPEVALIELEPFINKAEYVFKFNRVFLLPLNSSTSIPTLRDSPKWVAADEFLVAYPNALSAERDSVRLQMAQAQEAAFGKGWNFVQNARVSGQAQNLLTIWQNKASVEQLQEVRLALTVYAKEEQTRRDEQARRDADQARQRDEQERVRLADRAKRAKFACNQFYPGYVGQYKGTGFLATYDAFVVRYVNKGMESVTIEGTASGNSLKWGSVVEMACVDLSDRTR